MYPLLPSGLPHIAGLLPEPSPIKLSRTKAKTRLKNVGLNLEFTDFVAPCIELHEHCAGATPYAFGLRIYEPEKRGLWVIDEYADIIRAAGGYVIEQGERYADQGFGRRITASFVFAFAA